MDNKIESKPGRRVCAVCTGDMTVSDIGVMCNMCIAMQDAHFRQVLLQRLSEIAIALQRLEPGRRWTPGD